MDAKRKPVWMAGVALAGVVVLGMASEARAQIGGVPSVGPSLPGVPLPSGSFGRDLDRLPRALTDEVLAAPDRVGDLIRRSDGALQVDPQGWPVVSAEIVVIDLDSESRAWAEAAGYTVLREERFDALDLTTTVLAPPRRTRLDRAVDRLRSQFPELTIEYNHVHSPAGGESEVSAGTTAVMQEGGAGARLGLIDTGVDAGHPVFGGGRVTQRGFAGDLRRGAHGTAVASLMVGRSGAFSGGWPGAELLVADIYGGRADGGSSTAFVQALDWLAGQGATVINVSLVGPRNSVVERAVERAQARGVVLVAAVGNDGPAAAPLYPAAYPGVVGVSAVSGRNRILPEAGRGTQVDVTGPGADMAAASPGGGYTAVRGTSFASPIVAALIARRGGGRAGLAAVMRQARDLGEAGSDRTYGVGLVGADLRVAPSSVDARGRLSP